MTYHISQFQNNSDNNVLTANPKAQRDTYFIGPSGTQKPDHNPEINKGNWESYDAAFPQANFISTGVYNYSFWDTGKSQIAAVTDQNQNWVQLIYEGDAGNLVLNVQSDGTIGFQRAS